MTAFPSRLQVSGRLPDPDFSVEERLFRGLRSPEWPPPATPEALAVVVTIPTCAVRSKYCNGPEDTYHVVPDSTIVIAWRCGDIPPSLQHAEAIAFLRLEHCPENGFYPHCEIRFYPAENSVHQHTKKTLKPGGFRLWLRKTLSDLADWVHQRADSN